MKITLFALRYENKVYEFREPISVEIIKSGRMRNIYCDFAGLYISDYAKSYAKVFRQLGATIDYYYTRIKETSEHTNFITVREIA